MEKNNNQKSDDQSNNAIKGILIGIGVTLLIAILIGAFSLLMTNMKNDLKESLTQTFEEEFTPIKKSIEIERKMRISLAAYLMKEEDLDIPLSLLTSYEEIDKDDSLKTQFKNELENYLPTLALNELNQLEENAKLNDGYITLIAPFSSSQHMVALAKIKMNTVEINNQIKLAMTNDWFNILNSNNVVTGNVWLSNTNELKFFLADGEFMNANIIFYSRISELFLGKETISGHNLSEFRVKSLSLNLQGEYLEKYLDIWKEMGFDINEE